MQPTPRCFLPERKHRPGRGRKPQGNHDKPGARAGESYEIAILAYSGSVPGDLIIRTELVRVDDAVEKAYYDFLVPVQAARLLKKPDEENYRRILVKLGPAADALDLREPYSDRFYQSVEAMEAILKRNFTNTWTYTLRW